MEKVDIKSFDDTEEIEDPIEDDIDEAEEQLEENSQAEYSDLDDEVKVLDGIDGKHAIDTVPEIEVKVDEGIVDKDKSGTKDFSFTIRLRNFSDTASAVSMIRAIRKSFSEENEVEEIESESSDSILDELVESANELVQKAEELKDTGDKIIAKEVKSMCDEILEKAEVAEDMGHNVDEVKEACYKYSDEANLELGKDEDEYITDDLGESKKYALINNKKGKLNVSVGLSDTDEDPIDLDETELIEEEKTETNNDELQEVPMKVYLGKADDDESESELIEEPKINPNEGSEVKKTFSDLSKSDDLGSGLSFCLNSKI